MRLEHWVWKRTGINLFRLREDRRVLEKEIIPRLKKALTTLERQHVLSIGVDWHCLHYREFFPFPKYDFSTIDCDASKKPTIVCRMQEMHKHFPFEYLNIVLCNGVVGWGINDQEEVLKAFWSLFQAMSKGGVVVVGVDMLTTSGHLVANEIKEAGFEPYWLKDVGTHFYTKTSYRHLYMFFQKKDPPR